jgi:predicted lipoprotein with Yx(FWY)xxD motif
VARVAVARAEEATAAASVESALATGLAAEAKAAGSVEVAEAEAKEVAAMARR